MHAFGGVTVAGRGSEKATLIRVGTHLAALTLMSPLPASPSARNKILNG